jgi:acetyl-CoA acetyltransferase
MSDRRPVICGVGLSDRPRRRTAEYLGIRHRWIDGTSVGGSSFEFHVQQAAAAIRAGYADTVLVSYGSDQLSARGRTLGTGRAPTQEPATLKSSAIEPAAGRGRAPTRSPRPTSRRVPGVSC